MFPLVAMGQSDTLYYGEMSRGVEIVKLNKKKVWYKDGLFDENGIDLKAEPVYLFDSIYCHTDKVRYFQTGGKEMKEALLLSLGAVVAAIPTNEKLFSIAKLSIASGFLIASSVKGVIGILRLEAYEPKPSTKMVMIRNTL